MALSRTQANAKKLAVLKVIKENRLVLFGNFNNNAKLEKESAWTEVLKKAQSLRLAGATKTWTFVRDSLFGVWKSRTLAKRNNAGGYHKVLDEVDMAILDILDVHSPVVCSWDVPDSGQPTSMSQEVPTTSTPIEERLEQPVAAGKRRKLAAPAEDSYDAEEKRVRIELIEVEIYQRKLQCLKLERELQLEASKFTAPILIKSETDVFSEFEEQ